MATTPRPIFFSVELECPPIKDMAIGKAAVRRLYNALHQPGGYAYENLAMQGVRPTLSTNRTDDAQSRCEIGPYVIKVEEHQPEMPVDEFVGVLKTVLEALGKDRPALFFSQKCKIHCLTQTTHAKPLRILAGRIANVGGMEIAPFGRFPQFFGVRFRFSPWDPDDYLDDDDEEGGEGDQAGSLGAHQPHADGVIEKVDPSAEQSPEQGESPPPQGTQSDNSDDIVEEGDEEDPMLVQFTEAQDGFYTVRFEPFSQDSSQIWIEVSAVFPPQHGPFTFEEFDRIGKNIKDMCDFAMHRCKAFLDQFDTAEKNEGDVE